MAYKLVRQLKSGHITSLFINKKRSLPFNIWLDAEVYPTKGFALRPYWHCCSEPIAPHLSMKGRVWVEVEIDDYIEFNRPISQGGVWYLANRMKIIRVLDNSSTVN